jgi:hypothetical protein
MKSGEPLSPEIITDADFRHTRKEFLQTMVGGRILREGEIRFEIAADGWQANTATRPPIKGNKP